jgi:uncharacterized protein (TIGR02271 family)
MSWSQSASQIQVGDEVFGSDGEKVGNVAEVLGSYLVVEKGFFFPTDYYVPFSAVNTAENGQIFLSVAKEAALQSGWDTIPDLADTTIMDPGPVSTADNLAATDQDLIAGRPEMAAYEVAAEDDLVIPVREEELTATVRPREAGAVRVEKRVVEEDRVLDVPVTEEQVRVERRIVDRPAGAVDADAFEEIVIEVPLTEEEVELRKQARVTEEVVVSKDAVQHTEQVHGTVRREEVIVDEGGVLDPSLLDDARDADRPL